MRLAFVPSLASSRTSSLSLAFSFSGKRICTVNRSSSKVPSKKKFVASPCSKTFISSSRVQSFSQVASSCEALLPSDAINHASGRILLVAIPQQAPEENFSPQENDERCERAFLLAGHALTIFVNTLAMVWPYFQTAIFMLKLMTSYVEFLAVLPGGSVVIAFIDSIADNQLDFVSDLFGLTMMPLVKIFHIHPALMNSGSHMPIHFVDHHHPSQTLFTIVDNFDCEAPSEKRDRADKDEEEEEEEEAHEGEMGL